MPVSWGRNPESSVDRIMCGALSVFSNISIIFLIYQCSLTSMMLETDSNFKTNTIAGLGPGGIFIWFWGVPRQGIRDVCPLSYVYVLCLSSARLPVSGLNKSRLIWVKNQCTECMSAHTSEAQRCGTQQTVLLP